MSLPFNFLLLDAARLEEAIYTAREMNPHHASLYQGRSAEKGLEDVGPYLFDLSGQADFVTWYMAKGWGNAWGVPVQSAVSFQELLDHFIQFLLVKAKNGEELYFRFYDPRVLCIFLPTCSQEQIKMFFGPAQKFLPEAGDNAHAIEFTQQSGVLKQQLIAGAGITGQHMNPAAPVYQPAKPTVKRSLIIDDDLLSKDSDA